VNERVRSVVFGVGVGVGALLLLDLARILAASVGSGDTSVWWPVACYLAVGLVVAVGVSAGGRDRLVPLLAGVVVLLAALPAVPADAPGWLPQIPLVPSTVAAQAVAFAMAGAFAYGAVRGGRR
jgi:hypothetical protein